MPPPQRVFSRGRNQVKVTTPLSSFTDEELDEILRNPKNSNYSEIVAQLKNENEQFELREFKRELEEKGDLNFSNGWLVS